jgi:hypothetical protein
MNYAHIKKFTLLVAFLSLGFTACRTIKKAEPEAVNVEQLLVMPDGFVSARVLEILRTYGIETDGTLADAVLKTQRSQTDGGMLRPQGLERWELASIGESKRAWYIEQFKKLFFIDGIKATKNHYTYALIFGATIQGMRERLIYLLSMLTHEGIIVDHIVFLVGQRARDEKRESEEVLFTEDPRLPFSTDWVKPVTLPKTETDLARLIIAQSDIPAEIKERIIIIDAPMIQKLDGTYTRPTTDSTVQVWLETNPEPGSTVCISSQPHVIRQWYVARRLLPPEWPLECVGPAIDQADIRLSDLFDTLARTLWEVQRARA